MTQQGRKFRPSDWAERLTGSVSSFGPGRRTINHPLVKVSYLDGIKCIRIDAGLRLEDPVKYQFLMRFAHDNDLKTDVVQAANTTLEV